VPLRREYDFYLDGADQVAPNGDVVKGSWGAHVREKTLAALAQQRILICDEGKLVHKLAGPVPVAVVPFFAGLYSVSPPRIDENGLAIVNAGVGEIIESAADWDEWMRTEPGVVMTGLFPAGFVQEIIIGHCDGTTSLHSAGTR
jgi:ribose 5-phosphate isomerase A